jgi:hypothetical protein
MVLSDGRGRNFRHGREKRKVADGIPKSLFCALATGKRPRMSFVGFGSLIGWFLRFASDVSVTLSAHRSVQDKSRNRNNNFSDGLTELSAYFSPGCFPLILGAFTFFFCSLVIAPILMENEPIFASFGFLCRSLICTQKPIGFLSIPDQKETGRWWKSILTFVRQFAFCLSILLPDFLIVIFSRLVQTNDRNLRTEGF